MELRINALSDQVAKEVYYIKLSIQKKILGIININVVLLNKSFSSNATLLALDNAPGGVKDLNDEGDLSIPLIISRFCHVATFSSLDIGGGTQTITAADLTKSYSAASPPLSPKNVRVNNFMTNPSEAGTSNEIHTQMTLRNGQWLLSEIQNVPAYQACAYVCASSPLSISGSSTVCSPGTTFTILNAPPSTSIQWTVSPGTSVSPASFLGGTSFSVATLPKASASETVTASVVGGCSATTTKSIFVGIPRTPASIYTLIEPCATLFAECPWQTGATSYDWYIDNGFEETTSQPSLYRWLDIDPLAAGLHSISVKAMNTCGGSSLKQGSFSIQYDCGQLRSASAYPNPGATNLNIQVADTSSETLPFEYSATLINQSGTVVKSATSNLNNLNIAVGDLPRGLYILKAHLPTVLLEQRILLN